MAKVNVTNKQLLEISGALNIMSRKDTPAWYQIGRNLKRIEKPLEDLYKAKESIFQKLAEKDEKGHIVYTDDTKRQVKFAEGNEKEAETLWSELQKETTEIDFYTFSFEKFEGEKLNPAILAPLLDVIITD